MKVSNDVVATGASSKTMALGIEVPIPISLETGAVFERGDMNHSRPAGGPLLRALLRPQRGEK